MRQLLSALIALALTATAPASAATPHSPARRPGTAPAHAPNPQKKPSSPAAPAAPAVQPIPMIDVPFRSWTPRGAKAKAVLLCVHGLGLNAGSYQAFGEKLAPLGVATYAVDVRGFGTWAQMQGDTRVDFEACLEDVRQAAVSIAQSYGDTPTFILGESMGGAIALRFASTYPDLVDGLVSAVPSGDRFQQKQTELKIALNLLAHPRKPVNIGKGVIKQATDDQAVADAWSDDPLNRMSITAEELLQFQSFMNENHASALKITDLPVLVIQGFRDKLVKPEGTIELFNTLPTRDKLLVVVGDREHLIFEQGQFTDEVIQVLLAWIRTHSDN